MDKKHKLSKLKVQSFVTSLERKRSKTIKGGETETTEPYDYTEGPIVCPDLDYEPYSDECASVAVGPAAGYGYICAVTEDCPDGPI